MDLDPQGGKIYEFIKKVFMFANFRKWGHIAVSPSVYERLKLMYGSKRVFLVENAISTKRLDKRSTNPFLKNNREQLTIMGTDYVRKGVDIAIKAIDQNSELSSSVNLNVVTHTVNRTRQLIKDQFSNNVFSFVNIVPTDTTVQDFYNNSVAFLSPSRHEAFGYANVEAAYCGTQVIASDVPGQDTLKKIPYISWVAPENAEDLSQALLSTLNKSQKEIGKETRINKEYIKENYSLDNWVKSVYNVYQKIANS
ncbi:glycosyltransferase family 4 protein [Limosilactobacillus frumenti]|uniref:glycosyltransferase family 4 protein n=1 Tax=Limosilactobacillus frumenti TaxID=104955 RepID=UPI0015EC3523|nr:glycosyltransferase [Limosilactobacillus frumenti]MBA2913866.1 glycosyltransferase [Limosilactobacillus frumenti]